MVWKLITKSHLKWNWETKKENSHACVTHHTWQTPTGRRQYLESLIGNDVTLLPQQEEVEVSLHPVTTAQSMGDCHSTANEKSLFFELSVSPNGLFIYNSPSQITIFSFFSLDLHLVSHLTACTGLQFFVVPKWTLFVGELPGYLFMVNSCQLQALRLWA